MRLTRTASRALHGFSLVELVVASSLTVAFFGAVALTYRSVSVHQKRLAKFGSVLIGTNEALNFYDIAGDSKDVYWAPNYGTGIRADRMKEQFLEDLQHSSAVYCLPRVLVNSTRPSVIPISTSEIGADLDTPESFRQLLAVEFPASASVFKAYRGVPTATEKNASIFVLHPSGAEDELWVWAVYEIDFVDVTNPEAGTFASVRRYVNGTLTHFYDILYPLGDNTPQFGPPMALFERRARLIYSEGSTIDRFKKAADSPFYFLWWPDPAMPILEAGPQAATYLVSDPRAAYALHEGQTGYFFVVPMFPSMQ